MDFSSRTTSDGGSSHHQQQRRNDRNGIPCLRLLCLHDEHSNASELSHALEALGERLYERHSIDLIYINSPLLSVRREGAGFESQNAGDDATQATEDTDASDAQRLQEEANDGDVSNNPAGHYRDIPEQMNYAEREKGRTWFEKYEIDERQIPRQDLDGVPQSQDERDEQSPPEAPSRMTRYVGMDASILLIKQVWKSMPFWGFIAVGQGASLASFLPLLPVDPVPSVGIFINGLTILEETERLIDDQMSTLHVVEEEASANSELLIRQFGGEVHRIKKKADIDPIRHMYGWNTMSTMNAIGKFLIQQKRALSSSASQSTVLSLQNQLYVAEQEAADLVAEEIARDPPSALMAVISPQHVGGWNGRKRDVGAGGAPCPPEFVLRREKRGESDGPSRVHPTQGAKNEAEPTMTFGTEDESNKSLNDRPGG